MTEVVKTGKLVIHILFHGTNQERFGSEFLCSSQVLRIVRDHWNPD